MRRSVQISVRLTPEEADRLDKAAAASGMPREAYVRHMLFNGRTLPKEVSESLFRLTTDVGRISLSVRRVTQTLRGPNPEKAKVLDLLTGLLQDVQDRLSTVVAEIGGC